MRDGGLRGGLWNWREMVWYGWVIGAAIIAANASITYFIGLKNLPALWSG